MDIEGVREASKSSLEIDFRDHTGTRRKQRVKWDGSQRHKKDWFVKREAILSAIGNGQIPDYAAYFPRAKWAAKIVGAASYTVESALLDWLRRKSDEISPSTMEGYRRSVNTTIDTFGDRTLDSIKWREVRDWLDSENRTQKRKSELLIPLRAIFARAYDDEDITKNPLEGRKPSGPSNPRAADPFELDEIKRFLDKAGEHRNYFAFAFFTGLRTSEQIALRWSNVNLSQRQVSVEETRVAGIDRHATKTEAGERIVNLIAPAYEALSTLTSRFKGEHVFLNGDRPWSGPDEIAPVWYQIMRISGIRAIHRVQPSTGRTRYRNPYQTRHTFASLNLSAGEHPMYVADQMGHKDWSFTAKTYAKFIKTDDQAGSKTEAIWRGVV